MAICCKYFLIFKEDSKTMSPYSSPFVLYCDCVVASHGLKVKEDIKHLPKYFYPGLYDIANLIFIYVFLCQTY